jgi:hypothetical protein
MARFVITTGGTVAGTDYNHPSRTHKKGDVVELNAAEQAALTGAGVTLRAATVVTQHDQLGEAVSVSNGS